MNMILHGIEAPNIVRINTLAERIRGRNDLHTAISRMRCLPPGLGSAISTDRQPSIASWRLRNSSSMVSRIVTFGPREGRRVNEAETRAELIDPALRAARWTGA
jgi:hypothetical protein